MTNQSQYREQKSLSALTSARRELDQAAQEKLREAAELLHLADEIERRIRSATKGRER